MIAPWHHDLGWRQPWGPIEVADRFVGVTLPYGWKDTTHSLYWPARMGSTRTTRNRNSWRRPDRCPRTGEFATKSRGSRDAVDGWFEYPLAGTPTLVIRLAPSPGSAVVSVRVEGTMDLVLATRIETLLDLL
ncbi:hypothetical protein ACFHW0_15450 [Micromonospora sp. LOL_025]|uniref:hypothetical protein n=1 Tax=Micromonospora sp. LOL_025 TaxID=3345413 RepID=UPI003A845D1E